MIYFVVSFSLLAAILWYRFQKSKGNSRWMAVGLVALLKEKGNNGNYPIITNIKMVCNELSQQNLTADSQVAEKSQNVKNSRCLGTVTEAIAEHVPTEIPATVNNPSQGNSAADSQVAEKSQNVKNSRCVLGTVTEAIVERVLTDIPATVNNPSQRNSAADSQVAEKSQNVKNSRGVLRTVTESLHAEIPHPLRNEPLSPGIQKINNNMNPKLASLNSLLESRKGIESQKKSSSRVIVNVSEIIKRNTKKKSPSGKSDNRKAQRTRK